MQETKGQTTKNHILQEGLMLASVRGLVNISIGGLAEKAKMSRSGLFAHFLSKEQLQLEILEYAGQLLNKTILEPALAIESPVARILFIKKCLPNWYELTDPKIPGGCIFLMATLEFDDRPGKIKDNLLEQQRGFLEFLHNTHDEAVSCGEFDESSDCNHFAFSFYSFYMGFQQYKRFFGDGNASIHYNRAVNKLLSEAKGHRLASETKH